MSMSEEVSGPIGRIYIRVGSEEIDLTGGDSEIEDSLGKILKTDTWQSALSKIRKSRDSAIEAATKSALEAKIPERGSSFGHLLRSCGIDKTGDIILASIHYLRSVERESDTPPREIRRLISQTGRWTEEEVEKWNLSLYINRMIEGGATERGRGPLLRFPSDAPDKNRFVVLTSEGLDYLEDLSIGE
tara:strand:+ start:229 stop:792 length:564 start_codon:yes stop_codon:yes gene_type:complete